MELEQYYHRLFPLDVQAAIRRYSHKFGEEDYFHSGDFEERVPSVSDGRYRPIFMCFCALGVLMDELVFTHFPKDYDLFRQVTRFPKVEYGVTGIHANPWSLLGKRRIEDGLFQNCASVFLRDMQDLLQSLPFLEANWERLVEVLKTDQDVGEGKYGASLRVLRNALKPEEQPQDDPNDPKYLRHILSDEEIEELGR